MSASRDSSGGVPRRVPRNEPAQVAGGLAIVLSVIAVVVGFLILRSISSSGDAVLGGPVAADVGAAAPAQPRLRFPEAYPRLPR